MKKASGALKGVRFIRQAFPIRNGNVVNGAFEQVDLAIECSSITVDSLLGDVNDDGALDVAGFIMFRRYMAGGYGVTINEEQSDMNQDGAITIGDLIQLRLYIVG